MHLSAVMNKGDLQQGERRDNCQSDSRFSLHALCQVGRAGATFFVFFLEC